MKTLVPCPKCQQPLPTGFVLPTRAKIKPVPPPVPPLPPPAEPAIVLNKRQKSAVEIVREQLRGKNVLMESTGLQMHFAVTEDEVIVGGILSAFLSIVNTSVKRYPIQSITAIDVGKIPGLLRITITIGGANEAESDKNWHIFGVDQYDEVQRLAAFILDLQRKQRSANGGSSHNSIPDQIRKLSELKDAGILTQAEFDAKKSALLARM